MMVDDIEFDEFDYYEQNEIKTYLPDDLIMEAIDEQIKAKDLINTPNSNNYLTDIDERINLLLSKNNDKPDLCKKVKDIKTKIYIRILDMINERFNLTLGNFESEEQLYLNVKVFYDYFILSYDEMVIKFFENYITENMDDLLNVCKQETISQSKSNELKLLRKKFKNSKHADVLAHIIEIIDSISSLEIDGNIFLDYSTINEDDGVYPECMIRKLFIDESDTNFIDIGNELPYVVFKDIKSDDCFSTLTSNIKNDFIELFPHKN